MSFCANCGTEIREDQSFCCGCGTQIGRDTSLAQAAEAVPTADAAASHSSEATLRKLTALKAQAPPPTKSSRKILIAVLAVFFAGAIAAVAGVVYVGYRVKQKASAALDDFEGKSDARKATEQSGAAHSGKANSDKDKEGSAQSDSDNPLSAVLGKLQGAEGSGTTPMGNMAKNIFEDLGARNPEMPPDMVRNMPWATLTNPLPCPTGAQIDPEKLASGRILIKPGTDLTYSWSLPLADAESDDIIGSVSPSFLIFRDIGIAAKGLDMAFKQHV